jgi:hypothetical protein
VTRRGSRSTSSVAHPTKTLPVGKDVVAAVAGSAAGLVVLGLPAYAIRASLDPIDLESYRWWIVLSKESACGNSKQKKSRTCSSCRPNPAGIVNGTGGVGRPSTMRDI